MSKIVHVTDSTWSEEIKDYAGLALVDFWASWCGPCRMIAPIIEQLSEEETNVKVCKLNVDENPRTAFDFQITGIPTMLLFKNGEKVDQVIGFTSKDALKSVINRHI